MRPAQHLDRARCPRSGSARNRTRRSASSGSLTSMPSISTLVWLELVPRMKTEVVPPGPPVCTTLRPGHVCQHVGQGALLLALDLVGGDDGDAAADLVSGVGRRVARDDDRRQRSMGGRSSALSRRAEREDSDRKDESRSERRGGAPRVEGAGHGAASRQRDTSPRTKVRTLRSDAKHLLISIGAPRPTCSRVTTADGRSPGSRVTALRRLPGCPSGMNGARLAAYSCGGSRGFGRRPSPRSLLIPEGNHRGMMPSP